ncbi:universal stress protein [Actinocrinis puniceicyclus]|uniref:Universal stress protein n=1 Tax=Actinocrinis puniceicyclus TaxID=977794 RepID=A0A8J7WKQ5_9ACTN|nr:universal stress protein [Actinocrinis puniceicyclus]MBS2961517.1 universal stress protein [Actinocrinis puniceicyclus]
MNTYPASQRIVVGVDGSRGAARAADWAAALAAHRGTGLHLVHALNLSGAATLLSRLPFEEYRQNRTKQAEELLDRLRSELLEKFPGLWISTEICADEPAEALVAASGQAALTVVGTRGHGGFPGLRLGSVGLRLAAHSHGPMVLVPAEEEPAAEHRAGHGIVLGVAAREPAEVIDFGFLLAEELGEPLRAVHAWQPVPPYNGYYYIEPSVLATAADELLKALLKPALRAHDMVPAQADAVCAVPAAALVDAARDARLLVLGAHRHRTALSIGVGSVLHALLTHAPCPVAIVPITPHGAQN